MNVTEEINADFSHGSSLQLCRERVRGEYEKSITQKPGTTQTDLICNFSTCNWENQLQLVFWLQSMFFPKGLGEAFPSFKNNLKLSFIFSNNILV